MISEDVCCSRLCIIDDLGYSPAQVPACAWKVTSARAYSNP